METEHRKVQPRRYANEICRHVPAASDRTETWCSRAPAATLAPETPAPRKASPFSRWWELQRSHQPSGKHPAPLVHDYKTSRHQFAQIVAIRYRKVNLQNGSFVTVKFHSLTFAAHQHSPSFGPSL